MTSPKRRRMLSLIFFNFYLLMTELQIELVNINHDDVNFSLHSNAW